MDSMAKLYDIVLCKKLTKWFRPDREQEGAQQGRGCTEQTVSCRLPMDYVLHKKVKS